MNDTLPDYVIARNKMTEILKGLNLKFEVSSATAKVEGEGHVFLAYTATINVNSFDYSMGIGHIDWKKVSNPFDNLSCIGFTTQDKQFINTYVRHSPGCNMTDKKAWAAVCEKVANKLKTAPTLVDVLSCVLMDASALDMTFEDWCSEFGYDVDSRSAEKTYNVCCDSARKVKRFLDRKVMEELTDLANQL